MSSGPNPATEPTDGTFPRQDQPPAPASAAAAPPASTATRASSSVQQAAPPASAVGAPPTAAGRSPAPSGEGGPAAKQGPIPAVAKDELYKYFKRLKWALNRNLPRGRDPYDSALQKIMDEHGLNRDQVRRQLSNYKKKEFKHSGMKLTLSPEDIKERIVEGLKMTSSEFVDTTLKKISKKHSDMSSNKEFENFQSILDDFPPVGRSLLDLFISGNESDMICHNLLARCVDKWNEHASEEFPKTAARISDSELQFQKRNDVEKGHFIEGWVKQYESIGVSGIRDPGHKSYMSEYMFRYFGSFLHDCMMLEWAFCAIDSERPSVSITGEDLVSKYAKKVIYYVASWTLLSMSKALTVAKKDRGIYHRLAANHKMEESEAREAGLEISLVLRRKRRANVFCTESYYKFICFVESVYLENLNLNMMMAYCDGDIIHVIKVALVKDAVAFQKFREICNNDENDEPFTDNEVKRLMQYVLDRYANMRGTYFVKYLNSSGKKSSVEKMVSSQSRRTQVLNATATSKAVGEAQSKISADDDNDKQQWEDAADSVIEQSDRIDAEDSNADDDEL